MNKETALKIVKENSDELVAEYIIELRDIIDNMSSHYSVESIESQIKDQRWIESALDEIGDNGMYFAYFVAGFRCCEAVKK